MEAYHLESANETGQWTHPPSSRKLVGHMGIIFLLKCVWHCWAPVGMKEACSSLLCSWQCHVGYWWKSCAAKEGKEMVQLTGQLQPAFLACFVPEIVMCLGCHLLVKFGFCLMFFFLFHFGLPLTELCRVHASGTSLFCVLGSAVSLEQKNIRFLIGQGSISTLTKVLQRNPKNRLDGTKGSSSLFPHPEAGSGLPKPFLTSVCLAASQKPRRGTAL